MRRGLHNLISERFQKMLGRVVFEARSQLVPRDWQLASSFPC